MPLSNPKKLRVALVGLGFGAEFVPIYRDHPLVGEVTCCDPTPAKLNTVCDQFGIKKRYTSLEDVLADEEIDAVHLVTPIPMHARQSIAVLRSGKHCACTVPMATSFDDIRAIIQAQKESGKMYMMMETAVYTREFFAVQERFEKGEFGPITFARGAHTQDIEGWPSYWGGLPPHHYMTHAIAPILRLLGTDVQKVHCLGSGTLPILRQRQYSNPFPAETAIFRLRDSDVAIEVTRTLFQTSRPYSEAFSFMANVLDSSGNKLNRTDRTSFLATRPIKPGLRLTHTANETSACIKHLAFRARTLD